MRLSFIVADGFFTGQGTYPVNHLSVALQLIDFYMFSSLMCFGGSVGTAVYCAPEDCGLNQALGLTWAGTTAGLPFSKALNAHLVWICRGVTAPVIGAICV